ncbi:MAG: SUMF1/EgtB/PvdO family nonheme iron enzyme, partial [Verrucomicrobiae bacterium]|nr:SUMF1/EgtB/PvdO family nonheme iron enzyme [Verrucomicrobiae bacterium]
SMSEGIPKEQWCYADEQGRLALKPGFETKLGYRLPTLEEWKYAATGEAVTDRPFGSGDDLLRAFMVANRDFRESVTSPVGRFRPNRFGLFDVLGNVSEFCHRRVDGQWDAVFAGGSYEAFIDRMNLEVVDLGDTEHKTRVGQYGFRLAVTLP